MSSAIMHGAIEGHWADLGLTLILLPFVLDNLATS